MLRIMSNEEYRARIHSMVDQIESNFRLRRLYCVIYYMHKKDTEEVSKLLAEIGEGTDERKD